MHSIYANLIERARKPVRPDPVEPKEMQTLLRILSPVLKLAAALRAEGLLASDPEEHETSNGIEFRWKISDSRFLVVHGLRPIDTDYSQIWARIVAGVSQGDRAFIGMPACGIYPIPRDEKDGLGTHAVILGAIADLVAQHRNGSNS